MSVSIQVKYDLISGHCIEKLGWLNILSTKRGKLDGTKV